MKKINIKSKKTVHKGYVSTMDVYNFEFEKFDGTTSRQISREVLVRKPCVVVMPIDPVLQKIILIEQIRIGPIAVDYPNPWLLEFVAGMIDTNESPQEVAIRETKEESGLDVIDIFPIVNSFSSPGASSENMTLYCARVDATNAGGIHGLDYEDEDIRVHCMSFDDAFAMLAAGEINNSATLIGLQWLKINLADVLERWDI